MNRSRASCFAMNQKGTACRQAGFTPLLILLGVLALVLIGGGAYYLQSKEALLHFGKSQVQPPTPQPQTVSPTPQPTSTTDEIANWKNLILDGWTVKYPSNLKFCGASDAKLFCIDNEIVFSFGWLPYKQSKDDPFGCGFNFQECRSSLTSKARLVSDRVANGIKGFEMVENSANFRGFYAEKLDKTGVLYFGQNKRTITIDNIYEGLLQSLKLGNEYRFDDKQLYWKTYTNDKLGIEFKYPEAVLGVPTHIETTSDSIWLWYNPYPNSRQNTGYTLITIKTNKDEFIKASSLSLCEEVGTPLYKVPCLFEPIKEVNISGLTMKKLYIRDSDTTSTFYIQSLAKPIEIEYGGDEEIISTFKFTN